MGGLVQSFAERIARDHLRLVRRMGIQPVICPREQLLLEVIAYDPIYEITALILVRGSFGGILYAQAVNLVPA